VFNRQFAVVDWKHSWTILKDSLTLASTCCRATSGNAYIGSSAHF